MHTIHIEVYILPNLTDSEYTNLDELLKLKIPALRRAAENNTHILNQIALKGPLLPYDIFNDLKKEGIYVSTDYPTVNRRIKDLTKKEYLAEAGKRGTARGKKTKESMYGLTWKGFIASLSINEVRKNIFQVIRNNPLLTFPEKESILQVIEEIITPEELKIVSESYLEAYLRVIPNLEMIRDDQLLIWLFAINELPQLPENFTLTKIPENGWELLDNSTILKILKEKIVPSIRQKTDEITSLYMVLRELNKFGEFIAELDEKDKPSKKIKEYLENQVPIQFSDESQIENEKGVK